MHAHLKAIKKKHEALADIAKADLKTYLTNQVAIGEHPDIGAEIEKKIETIAHHNGIVGTINEMSWDDSLSETRAPE
jgi:hypothetical protein